jgi:hypothetical protein
MAGYSPASANTSNLPQSVITHYDKEFVKNLKPNVQYLRCANPRELPPMSGNQHQLFMYSPFGANITQTSEGTVGTGIPPVVLTNSSRIGQWSDYVNFSDYALALALDPALDNIEKEMALRLALTVGTITKNVVDGANVIDASALIQKAAASPLVLPDLTSAVQSLRGRNVLPFDMSTNEFYGIIHPFCVGDVRNDSANNSLTDILKHTSEGQGKLEELPAPDGEEVQLLKMSGLLLFESTLVTQTPNYKSSGNTSQRTYIFGNEGVIRISLGKKFGIEVGEGDWRNLKLWMMKQDVPSPSDPARVIGGWTSYNTLYTATFTPDPVMRVRMIDSVSNVS